MARKTVIELRNMLASHKLDTTGTRAILIARLKSYLETHPVQDSVQEGPKQKKRKIDPKEKKPIRKLDANELGTNCTLEELRLFIRDRGGRVHGTKKEEILEQAKVYASKDPKTVSI